MRPDVTFLGHVLTENGFYPDPKNVEKIANLRRPKSVAEVRTLLGMTGFFRSFIKDYGTIAYPLVQKTSKESSAKPFI